MLRLVSLFVATALVVLQNATSNAHIIDKQKIDLDNELPRNEVPQPRRHFDKKYVQIETPPPKTITYVPGTAVVLTCGVTSSPAPVVVWTKNGFPISDFEEETNEIISIYPISYVRLTSKLVVTSAVSGDVFTCVAVAGVKEATASTTVYVEKDEPYAEPAVSPNPIITAFYNHILQTMGTSLTLPCRVHSPTQYQILWLNPDDKVVYNNPRMRVLPSGDLQINNLVWEDMGLFTCSVKNMYGKEAASTFVYPVKP